MIRKATVEDLPKMEACAREFYASSKFLTDFDPERFTALWTGLFASDIGVIFIVEDGGEIRGAIGGVVYPDTYSPRQIASEFFWWISPGHRGEGLKLYREFESWAKGKQCQEIRMVHLLDSMPEKLERVYRHLGFHPVEVCYSKEIAA